MEFTFFLPIYNFGYEKEINQKRRNKQKRRERYKRDPKYRKKILDRNYINYIKRTLKKIKEKQNGNK
jgi:hypothetical protein